MGFFNDLFGSSSKSSSATNQTVTQAQSGTKTTTQDLTQANQSNVVTGQTSTTAQAQTTAQTGQTTNVGQTTATTLDPATIALLQGVIGSLATGAGDTASTDASTIRSLSSTLANNQNPDLVNANIASSQAEAVREFGIGEGAQISGVQQQIGSKGNSFSQLLAQRGNIDLSTSLASISNQARLAAASQESTNLQGAITGTSAAVSADQVPLNNFLKAIQTLTGAQTTQATTSQQLSDLIAQLTGTTGTTSTGTTATTGTATQAGTTGEVSQAGGTATTVGTSSGTASNTLGLFPTLASLGL